MWRIVVLTLACLGVWMPVTAQPIPEPSIAYFYITPPNPVYGEDITFNWQVEDATRLQVNDIVLENPNPVGTHTVNSATLYDVPGTYTLTITATNALNGITRSRQDLRALTLLAQPPQVTVELFTVTPQEVAFDESITVTWSVTNANQLYFYGQPLPARAQGSANFLIADLVNVPGNYEVDLFASDGRRSDTAYTTISVIDSGPSTPSVLPLPPDMLPQAPEIITFYVTPSQASINDVVTVTWETRNAAQLRLNNQTLDAAAGAQAVAVRDLVPGDGDHYVYLTAVAEDEQFNNVRWQAALTVRTAQAADPPTINAFSITPADAEPGDIVTLSWDVDGADALDINGFTIEDAQLPQGTLAVVGDALLDEPGAGTVTLTARDSATNAQSSADAPLTLAQPRPTPQILAFTVNNQNAALTETVILRWQVFNADGLRLDAFDSSGNIVYSRLIQNADLPNGALDLDVTDVAGGEGMVTLNLWALTDNADWDDNVRALPLFVAAADAPPPSQDETIRISNQAPRVESFTLTPQRVTLADTVTVTWSVRGAEAVYLNDVLLSRTATGRVSLSVAELADDVGVHWLHLTARGGQIEQDAWVALIVGEDG